MKTNYLLTVLVVLGALLLAGCTSKKAAAPTIPESAKAGDLTKLQECEFQVGRDQTKVAAECGTLIVPQNWDVVGSSLIELPVVRIPASQPNPAEPLFFLEGGPGQTNLSWPLPGWSFEKHDVVMVGYRGVDGTVRLNCPELGSKIKNHLGKDLFSDQARQDFLAATKLCAETHQKAGVDLSGFTIPGVIEDMEAARKALGYERINLFSVSYGTRLAQIYAYMHPGSLHRSVLIGVNTPGRFLYYPAEMDQMIRYISKLCAQDTACSSRTDDLAQVMYDVNHNMPTSWNSLTIDPGTIRFSVHNLFFANSDFATIIDIYLAAAEGDYSGLALGNAYARAMFPVDEFVYGDTFNKGGTMEKDKYAGIESISLGDSIMGAPWAEFGWPMTAEWPVELVSKELREFQESDVEMLLVNGTIDFSTPPYALEEARPYFHKAQMVLLPEFSHVADVLNLQPKAFERLITTYYDTGVADDSLFVYQPLSFKPKMSLVVIAHWLTAALVVLAAMVALGMVLAVRRIIRRRTIGSQALAWGISHANKTTNIRSKDTLPS